MRVIVAVRPAPACTPDQLTLTYRGNGDYRGTNWGAVVISDTAQAPCRLSASARITGLDQSGQPMTPTYTGSIKGISIYTMTTTALLILSPRMSNIPDGLAARYGFPPRPGGLAGAIRLEGRSGSTSARARARGVVRAWRVVIGGVSRTVPNADPAGLDPIVPSGALVTCGGRVAADLTYYCLLTF